MYSSLKKEHFKPETAGTVSLSEVGKNTVFMDICRSHIDLQKPLDYQKNQKRRGASPCMCILIFTATPYANYSHLLRPVSVKNIYSVQQVSYQALRQHNFTMRLSYLVQTELPM